MVKTDLSKKHRRLNIYTCGKCSKSLVSEDLDVGVTPFMLPCKCGFNMHSAFYRVKPEVYVMPADIEWYHPEKSVQLAERIRDHVNSGGLIIRVASPRAEHLRALEKASFR